jgi:hypothetical protein
MQRRRFLPMLASGPFAVRRARADGPGEVAVYVEGLEGEERRALSQTPVFLLRIRPSWNLPFPMPVRSEVTGRDGWARFHGVEPGVYAIHVRTTPPRDGNETWLPKYAGGAGSWRLAERFAVRPGGAPLEFRMTLDRGRAVQLKGVARDEDGRPAAGAKVTLTREDQPLPPVAKAAAGTDGRFDFGWQYPDAYRLRAEWEEQSVDEPFALTAEGQEAKLRLERRFALEGRVEGEALRKFLSKAGALRIHALPENGALFDEAVAPVKSDGSFVFPALAPGRYQLQPSRQPEGFYLERVRLAGVDVLGEFVELHRGYGPLEVLFEEGPGGVTGMVEDATEGEPKPAAGAVVAMLNHDPRRRHFLLFIPIARTEEGGRFTISGLAPGEYFAWAFDRLETRDLNDELLVERLRPLAKTVKIARNQTSRADLRLQLWEVAAGT